MIGKRVTEEVLSTRNKICALLAVSLLGFSCCKSCIAFKPNGVAALSNPKKFAERFMVIEPIAECPFGNSGINLVNKGVNKRANLSIKPACSAIFIMPSQKVKMPIKPIAISTATFDISKIALIICSKIKT